MEHKSRTPGSGFDRLDDALVAEMRALLDERRVATIWAAAQAVADRAAGGGTLHSRARRLVRKYIKRHGQGTGEPDSTESMETTAAAQITALQLRIASLESALAHKVDELHVAHQTRHRLARMAERQRVELEALVPRIEALEQQDSDALPASVDDALRDG